MTTETAPKPFVTRSKAVRATTLTITPEIAAEWLGKNSHNRPIRQRQVDFLAGAIRRGEWLLNGDAVRFDVNDVLLDGQHRLWAIVEAEEAVESVVIVGLPPDAQETMDVGARRSLADALRLRGHANGNKIAALLSYWWRYQNGYLRTAVTPTIAQALAVLDENPGLLEAARQGENLNRRFHVSLGAMAACWYEFDSIDPDGCFAFFDGLVTGVSLEAGDPRLVLRQYFAAQAAAGVGARAAAYVHHALTIKAWDAARDGRKIDRLSWKASGLKAERFPEAY